MRVYGAGTVSLPISIGNGGTGQTTAAAALAALGGVGAGAHSLKRGSASANYVITATSLTAIDDPSLKVTVTVPTGQIAIALFLCSAKQVSGATGELGIAVDGTTSLVVFLSGSVSNANTIPMTVAALLVGDGSSHTFSPVALTTNAADAFTIQNDAAIDAPMHIVVLIQAT